MGHSSPSIAASPNGADLTSIARFSRVMEIVLMIFMVLFPIALAVLAFGFPEQLTKTEMLGDLKVTPGPLALHWKLAVLAVLLVASAPLLYALNSARHMFLRFRFGAIFTPMTATRIRQIALGLLIQALVAPLGGVALSAILSGAGKAEGLVLTISSDQILIALFAFIFLGLARVMHAAALLAEDNAAIV